MTDIPIPSEDDFKAMADEALENNRRNCLPAKPPTEITREGVTFTTTTPPMAAAWVDDMAVEIRRMLTEWEIDEWVASNQRAMRILETYFPDEDWRLLDEIKAARGNARTIEL